MSETPNYKYHIKINYRFRGHIKNSMILQALKKLNTAGQDRDATLDELIDRGKMGIQTKGPEIDYNVDPKVWYGKISIPVVNEYYCRIVSTALDGIKRIHPYDRGGFDWNITIVKMSLKRGKIVEYGTTGLSCGPGAVSSRWIILVEGTWDVMNLNDAGYNNALAFNGSKMYNHAIEIRKICDSKDFVLALIDDDSGGKTNERNLKAFEIKVSARRRAPAGTEVEDLSIEDIRRIVEPEVEKIRGELNIAKPAVDECWEKPLKDVWGKIAPKPPMQPKPVKHQAVSTGSAVLQNAESIKGQKNNLLRFSTLIEKIQNVLHQHKESILDLLIYDHASAYDYTYGWCNEVASKYRITLMLSFPEKDSIYKFGMYGKRNLSIIMNRSWTIFTVSRDEIKAKAAELLLGCRTEDASKDSRGIRIIMDDEGSIEIFPHSLNIWSTITGPVTMYCDWLFENVYMVSENQED